MSDLNLASLKLADLKQAYAAGLTPHATVRQVCQSIEAYADSAVFISQFGLADLLKRADELANYSPQQRQSLALYGVPFAVKDNIDVKGLPTTAACPEFAYFPTESATVVQLLEDAGAIVIGKTNLDQFATGLVGTRSPYGTPRNPFNADYIPGGSSSGSAVAVAAGLVSFALGTDTAGSGRIPAGANGLTSLKPTPGLMSTQGVVPACRTLDCVSIFTHHVAEAAYIRQIVQGYDVADPYSIKIEPILPPRIQSLAIKDPAIPIYLGIPDTASRRFFGDTYAEQAFDQWIQHLDPARYHCVDIDFTPLFAVAALLYQGPWIAERLAAIEDFFNMHAHQPNVIFPITQSIIEQGRKFSAVETFKAQYQLKAAQRQTEKLWQQVDVLIVPTVPRFWTLAEVAANPLDTNAALGTYTNFVNLLGMAALAIPTGKRADQLPAGVTLIGAGGTDAWLTQLGQALEGIAV